jgi:hypothetical protein
MKHTIWIPTFIALGSLTAPAAYATTFTISPVSFDFGNIGVGSSGISQRVTITNTSATSQTLNLAGGGGGAAFGGVQNCQAQSLAPGASCYIEYDFNPTAKGLTSATTTVAVNGQTATFNLTGNGIDSFQVGTRSLDFGNVASGSTSNQQTVTIRNASNTTQTVNLAGGGGGASFGGVQNCQAQSLAPGGTCQISYAFTPSTAGEVTGSTTVAINGQSVDLAFAGTGGTGNGSPFTVSGRSFDFGNVALGESSPQETVTITNTSNTSQVISLAGGGAGALFGGVQNCQGQTLAPGGSCSVFYSFSPTDLGSASGTTTLGVNGFTYDFSFAGSGIEPFLLGALSFDFGEVNVGSSSFEQATNLYNVGDIAHIFGLAGGGAGPLFGGVQNCVGQSITPGDFCSIFYQFTPATAGLFTASTTLDIDGIARTLTFRGVGIDPNAGPSPVPEPATWASMVLGFGYLAATMRRSRRRQRPI